MDRSQKIRFNKIRKVALNGDYKESIPAFQALRDDGVIAASASLAEIYAFLFDWENSLENAGSFVAFPCSSYAGNVFDDMIRLVWRAAQETQSWDKVKSICRNAVEQIEVDDYQPFQKRRYISILENLENLVKNKGVPPEQELIAIFKTDSDRRNESENRDAYLRAIEKIDSVDANKGFEEIIRKKFALAIAYDQTENATEIFLENESLPVWDFQFLLPVVKYLIRNKKEQKAWQIVKNNIPNWIPVDPVQIAPVELLVDQDLKTIMNMERGLEVLRTQRA